MKIYLFFLLIILMQPGCRQSEKQSLKIVNLRCEHLSNPIGLDTEHPRLSWALSDSTNGSAQSAYQIIVAYDRHFTTTSMVWESKKTSSSDNMIRYGGPALLPQTKYYWGVQVWDRHDNNVVSETASFETGMMGSSRWKGNWISDTRDIDLRPAPYFRKEFEAPANIVSARAYIAVAGLYELSVNGERIGDHMLDPLFTRYDRRTLYITYDVTDQLRKGTNAIGVLLGNGWYNHQSTAVWFFDQAPWRDRPKFCLDIRLDYEDGTSETISTDESWKTALSPVVSNSIYTGEQYDARLEQPGWDTPGFDDQNWQNSLLAGAPSQHIVAQSARPIRIVDEIQPVSITKTSKGTYVYDLGKNIAGITGLKVSGARGTTIRLIHGELLNEDGHVDQSNIDVHYRPTDDSDPFQTDIYILSGQGEESFRPRFSYKGFQFVEVQSDQPVALHQHSLTGYVMHSDVPPVGHIHASNETINRIWAAGNSSYLANLFGYPTDCPQREKNGWTGDAAIAVETGLYSYDAITVYEKWLADHRDEQQPNGVLPAIIPTAGWGYHWANGPDWTSTIAIIPWQVYQFYGDTKILEDNYENIKRYVDHIDNEYPSGLTDWGLGDWVPVKSKAPKELTSSAYYYADATILSQTAGILGKPEDEQKYAALAEKIKNAVNDKYLNRGTGIYGSGMQTELSVPLYWGLVPEELVNMVAANLAAKVATDSFHIDVGLLGSKAILNALSDNGYADVAYQIAAQETFPSWGWWIVNGASTFYENWDIGAMSDLSLNHIMFGEINAWLYKALGGIKPDPEKPGFKNILLKPHFVDGLDSFSAEHEGPFGKIVSSWKKSGSSVIYHITIPPNSSATLWLHGEQVLLDNKKITDSDHAQLVYQDETNFKIQMASGSFIFEIINNEAQ
ncbi:MAG: family 78 glycoside hydrolase catalytic domain [Cyclobacteriaceae bacterium]|nr:family 78 glycoside hydrolase catalytic domain [Cyclobacteriaceae bacterium]